MAAVDARHELELDGEVLLTVAATPRAEGAPDVLGPLIPRRSTSFPRVGGGAVLAT